jgi:hypothetical protein
MTRRRPTSTGTQTNSGQCGFLALEEPPDWCINPNGHEEENHHSKGGSNEEAIIRFGCDARRGERFRLCRRPGSGQGQRQGSSACRDEGLILAGTSCAAAVGMLSGEGRPHVHGYAT